MKEQDRPDYARYADFLENRFSQGILEELQPYAHFVTWVKTAQNKKIPYNPATDEPASTTNPETWGTLHASLTALASGRYHGIGFVFSEDDPFTGVDIDHCIVNNHLAPEARELVTDLWSYTELSPSRTGLHIIVQGSVPDGRRKNGIEVYSTGRYFTLTTNHLKGSPYQIAERQAHLDRLYASLAPIQPTRAPIRPGEHQLFVSDEHVLEKARNAANGQRFAYLYHGDTSGFRSKSEADFTLILYLLYWTNDDIEQTKRLFLQSGLADEKTLRPTRGTTYLDYTIGNALKKRR